MCFECERRSGLHVSRRSVLSGLAGVGLVASGAFAVRAQDATAEAGVESEATEPQNAITPQEALDRLMEGNTRYTGGSVSPRDFEAERAQRAEAQYPVASILSCADSRVAPELLFDQGPGDLFVVRVAGNILNADGLASMEFSVAVLSTPLIMVLGHSNCGAVKASIRAVRDKEVLPGHLPQLTEAIRPAVLAAKAEKADDMLVEATRLNVAHVTQGLRLGSQIIADALASKKVEIVGGIYDLATGKVDLV